MFRKIYQNDFCQKVHLSTRGILGNMEEIEEEIEELILKRYAKRSSSNSTKGKLGTYCIILANMQAVQEKLELSLTEVQFMVEPLVLI